MEADARDVALENAAEVELFAQAREGTDPYAAERARLEDEVRDLRHRVVDAETPEEAEFFRERLDEVEDRLIRLDVFRETSGCEGWPAGK